MRKLGHLVHIFIVVNHVNLVVFLQPPLQLLALYVHQVNTNRHLVQLLALHVYQVPTLLQQLDILHVLNAQEVHILQPPLQLLALHVHQVNTNHYRVKPVVKIVRRALLQMLYLQHVLNVHQVLIIQVLQIVKHVELASTNH